MYRYRRTPTLHRLARLLLASALCPTASCAPARPRPQPAPEGPPVSATSPSPVGGGDWWVRVREGGRVYAVSQDGRARRELPRQPPAGEVSPDGSRVLTTSFKEGYEVFVSDAGGANRRRVTAGEASDPGARWSPDGKHILFSSARGGAQQLYIAEADGSAPRRLTDDPEGAFNGRFAPDGRIAYLAPRVREKLAEMKNLPADERAARKGALASVDLIVTDGRQTTTLVRGRMIRDVEWSPDGALIAYSSMEDGGRLVWLRADGSAVREINSSDIDPRLQGYVADNLRWRPDGGALALRMKSAGGMWAGDGRPFGAGQLFVVPLSGQATWFDIEPRAAFDWIDASRLPK